jgi:hypothetical protein
VNLCENSPLSLCKNQCRRRSLRIIFDKLNAALCPSAQLCVILLLLFFLCVTLFPPKPTLNKKHPYF